MSKKKASSEILSDLRKRRKGAQKKLFTFRLSEDMIAELDDVLLTMNQKLGRDEKEFSRTEVVELAISSFMEKWK